MNDRQSKSDDMEYNPENQKESTHPFFISTHILQRRDWEFTIIDHPDFHFFSKRPHFTDPFLIAVRTRPNKTLESMTFSFVS
jgi:hypothetical protein